MRRFRERAVRVPSLERRPPSMPAGCPHSVLSLSLRAVPAENRYSPPSQCPRSTNLQRSLQKIDKLSAPFHKYDDVCGERDGVEGAKRRRGDAWYRRGGATKPSARPVATRRADGGCGRSLRWSSSKMAKHRLPPPALISPHKPHLHTSSYLWKGALSLWSILLPQMRHRGKCLFEGLIYLGCNLIPSFTVRRQSTRELPTRKSVR